jgi:hypothetical protein
MKNHFLIEFNLTIYPQTRSLRKTRLPKKILSFIQLSLVKKFLFMASESVEQQPFESIASAKKSIDFLADDAKLKKLELHKILCNYELLLVLSVHHTTTVPYTIFSLGNTI